jgi:hypothetical protein
MIRIAARGYMRLTMAKYTPLKGRQGRRSRVQIAAPDTEAMGIVRMIGRPRLLFRSAAM